MKILHLIHKPQNRGAEIFACQLAGSQLRNEHNVRIITVYPGTADISCDSTIENIWGKEEVQVDWKAWRRLALLVNDFQPDIIQANSGDTLKYAVFSKKIFGWKAPIIARNASEVGKYLKSRLHKRLNSFLYRNVVGVASVSKASEKDILEHFPSLKGITHVIPVGLDRKDVNPKKLSPNNKKHIIHVGGFSFEKNHKGLISIFKKVSNTNPNTHLHLIGDGSLRSEIEALVEQQQIQDNITFHGFVNNPLDYIIAADVLVLPSIIEGLPGVLLEAMYCKTAVVAYNVGGISEIVSSKTGILINQDDEIAFAEGVIQSLGHRNSDQIDNAHNLVKAKFMNDKLAIEFTKFYEKILGYS
jgi:L-malate glycosyltransferase